MDMFMYMYIYLYIYIYVYIYVVSSMSFCFLPGTSMYSKSRGIVLSFLGPPGSVAPCPKALNYSLVSFLGSSGSLVSFLG